MILKIIRWLRGYVVFEIIGRFPERFINLSIRQGGGVFSFKPYSDKFLGSMLLSDYRTIRHTAKKSSVRLRVVERRGLPFIVDRYRDRAGLTVGFLLLIVILFVAQSFIWTIEINGVTTLSQFELKEALNNHGLYSGAFRYNKDEKSIQRSVMLDIKEIGWMSINLVGTKAEVELKEKDIKPHILEADIPCNIKASRDGVILRMNTKYGTAVADEGSAVIEGSLLVSGVNENPSGKVDFVHADAQVVAQTQHYKEFLVNRNHWFCSPANIVERKRIVFFWFQFPVTFSSVKDISTSRFEQKFIHLNETSMPLGLIKEHCVEFDTDYVDVSEESAVDKLTADDYLFRLFSLSECETISVQRSFFAENEFYKAKVMYTCTEDIAKEEKLVVN